MNLTMSSSRLTKANFVALQPKSAQKARIAGPAPRIVCKSQSSEDKGTFEKLALPAAAFLGAALLMVSTPDAAEAARSGGRVGGSSFSSRRSAPSAPRGGGGVRNYNYYAAPPLIGGYGYGMPFFGGGIGFMPFGIGGLFNILLLMVIANVVINTIKGFTNKNGNESWDDNDDERW